MNNCSSDFYDEILGYRKEPAHPSEYGPYDPLGLSSGRISCTMRVVTTPMSEDIAEEKEHVLGLIKKYDEHREKRKSRYFEQMLFKQIEKAIKTDHEQFYEWLEEA